MSVGKLLFVGGLLAVLAGILSYTLSSKSSRDDSEYIGASFGNPTPAGMQLDVVVSLMMTHKDPPPPMQRPVNWDNWVAAHFVLTDATGKAQPLRRLNFSQLVPTQIAGTYDFFVSATLKPGAAYTLTVTPFVSNTTRKFAWKFTVPAQPTEPERVMFERL